MIDCFMLGGPFNGQVLESSEAPDEYLHLESPYGVACYELGLETGEGHCHYRWREDLT